MSPVIEEIRDLTAPLERRLEPDAVLARRFQLREKLGEGAMGAVWSAEELATGRQVALKVLKVPARDARIRFLREAWAASRARHANVVDVLDLVEAEDGMLVIVMELLCGETLGALLRREGKLGVAETCAVLLSVVEAIAAVHRAKMIHRDVKPDNIFIEHKPDGRRVVKLLDFGVAKVMGDEPAAAQVEDAPEGILGTPYYMAPEQVIADAEIDERIDVWSLGVTFFECVAGRRPTEAPSVGRVLNRIAVGDLEPIALAAPTLPAALQQMTTRMMAADRSARPTLDELRRVFTPFARSVANTYVLTARHEVNTPHATASPPWQSRNTFDERRPSLVRPFRPRGAERRLGDSHGSTATERERAGEWTRGRGRPGGHATAGDEVQTAPTRVSRRRRGGSIVRKRRPASLALAGDLSRPGIASAGAPLPS